MAYNYKQLQKFINKVNEEAEREAQKVYDKYEKEFIQRIQSQLKDGDTLCCGMGTAIIVNEKTGKEDIGENLCNVLGNVQYWSKNIVAGLSLPHKITKTKMIKEL